MSATHDGYNSAFRYCFLPGKKKSALDLDKSPYLSKEHPVPKDACKFVQTSSAITASGAEAVRAECSGVRMPPNVPHVMNSLFSIVNIHVFWAPQLLGTPTSVQVIHYFVTKIVDL